MIYLLSCSFYTLSWCSYYANIDNAYTRCLLVDIRYILVDIRYWLSIVQIIYYRYSSNVIFNKITNDDLNLNLTINTAIILLISDLKLTNY